MPRKDQGPAQIRERRTARHAAAKRDNNWSEEAASPTCVMNQSGPGE